MEKLEKQVNDLLITFFRDCAGNRLNQFSWGAFKGILIKMIHEYKDENKTK